MSGHFFTLVQILFVSPIHLSSVDETSMFQYEVKATRIALAGSLIIFCVPAGSSAPFQVLGGYFELQDHSVLKFNLADVFPIKNTWVGY